MPTSYRLPSFNLRPLRNLLISLLCVLIPLGFQIPLAYADDFDNLSLNNTNPGTNKLKNDALKNGEEFLPVTEAFKVNASISNAANESQTLRLTWTIAPNYYLFQERFKFKATPSFALDPLYSAGKPKFDEFAGKDLTVFYEQVTIDFVLPAQLSAFDLAITSQGCADAGLCYPPHTQTLRIDPTTGAATTVTTAPIISNAAKTPIAPAEQLWLWQAVLFAIFGGMILNLMPCVFPILSIKVMSLVQADSARLHFHGWAYTLGIMLCFVGFATVLLIARTGGEAIGWGFQLQSPGLITALAYLFFVMGLSMSGLIQFGARWMGAGQSLTQKSGLRGSFFTGVLAALVASPCTAPFMGAALGFALTQPAISCLSVFAALGFGMALPLLLLCYSPSLAERLPKPGLWMETLKEFLAFPLYLSAIWLLWVLGHQAGADLMAAVCTGAVAIAFACWLIGRPATSWHLRFNKLLVVGALALAVYLPWQMLNTRHLTSRWVAYSPELVEQLRQQGRPVFIDFTADWCITCLANERVTLQKESVEAVFDEYKVATLKGDWTNRDPEISKILEEYGRSGVPLYLWFPANRPGKADILPQLLTPSVVMDAIKSKK
ncbi:MAG: protein-disulfide reductase DsbD [Pseudomonadota bacterium]